MGITGGNHDVADAVGFELKTSLSPNTPVTLFHKDPKPRGKRGTPGATALLVKNFGWPSIYKKTNEPVISFRATIFRTWKSTHTNKELIISANNTKISLLHDGQEYAFWDTNELITIASSKLRNMMLVQATEHNDGTISFTDASLLEQFQPLRFIQAIDEGNIAVDFDARTNPGKTSIRNHGTKFRIREKDLPKIYYKITAFNNL